MVPLSRLRVLVLPTLAMAACMLAATASPADARPPTEKRIKFLAKAAYTWGLAPEFVYRFEKYNDLVTAKVNTFGGGSGVAAAWNNNATNAGDASVLYLNSMMDLSGKGRRGTKELVMTVPPSASDYYVVNLLDSFINTVGTIGTRTTLSTEPQTYLIAGPTSKYAHRRNVTIKGFRYRVMPTDTNLNWMLIRIRADSLLPTSDPASTAQIQKTIVQKFALNTLKQFQRRGHRPKYFRPGTYTATNRQKRIAKNRWHNAPKSAVRFFRQVGSSLRVSPIPKARTGLQGMPLRRLPSWVAPQARAKRIFRNPSFGQRRTLRRFKPIGLTARGFRVPSDWRPRHIRALQQGFENGIEYITAQQSAAAQPTTNYWKYLNHDVGTYPNTQQGYNYRGFIVAAGGSANLGLDAIYAQINNTDGTDATQLKGDNTYKLTFRPPADVGNLPAIGGFPPTKNDADGNALGFWSLHVYQTDSSESAAPFLTQATVLNTSYSTADLDVVGVDAATDTLTVQQSPDPWSPLHASTPIMFGPTAAQYGLQPDTPYYLVKDGTTTDDGATYSFQVSTIWKQDLSKNNQGAVPIQGTDGTPGPPVQLQNPGGAVNLQWGPIKPVSQLGSQQLKSGSLTPNPDGSVTFWIGPELPDGAFASNWLPTPSLDYYTGIYGAKTPPIQTAIRPLFRIYYPRPGNEPPSILPPPGGPLQATYVFPKLEKVD